MLRTMKKNFVCKGIESKEEPRLAVTSESMFNFRGHYSHRIQCRWCSQDLFDRVEVCFHFLFYVCHLTYFLFKEHLLNLKIGLTHYHSYSKQAQD